MVIATYYINNFYVNIRHTDSQIPIISMILNLSQILNIRRIFWVCYHQRYYDVSTIKMSEIIKLIIPIIVISYS